MSKLNHYKMVGLAGLLGSAAFLGACSESVYLRIVNSCDQDVAVGEHYPLLDNWYSIQDGSELDIPVGHEESIRFTVLPADAEQIPDPVAVDVGGLDWDEGLIMGRSAELDLAEEGLCPTGSSDGDSAVADGDSARSDDDSAVSDGYLQSSAIVADRRICYAGLASPPDGAYVIEVFGWLDRTGEAVRVGTFTQIEDLEEFRIADGMLDAEGRLTGSTWSSLESVADSDSMIVTDDALLEAEGPVRIPAVPCDDVAEQMQLIDAVASGVEIPSETDDDSAPAGVDEEDRSFDSEAFTFGEEDIRVWSVVGETPVDILAAPGSPDTVMATVQPGTRLGGAGGAAVSKSADGRWIGVFSNNGFLPTSLGWINEDQIEPVTWPERLCFVSEEPQSVLVLDPASREAHEPLGAYVVMPAEGEQGEVDPEVRLLAEAPPVSAGEGGDELSVYVQNGEDWEAQAWVQVSFGVTGNGIAWESVECSQVAEGLTFIEAFRNDIPLPDPLD